VVSWLFLRDELQNINAADITSVVLVAGIIVDLVVKLLLLAVRGVVVVGPC